MAKVTRGFWKEKRLDELSHEEWESLCDGCARCCLVKLEDWDSGENHYTDVACHLLDQGTCRCTDYENRTARVPTCVQVTPQSLPEIAHWMPVTCAYRLLWEGEDLRWWHPLVSGDPETVHRAGISVRGRIFSEEQIPEEELEDHIVDWPHWDVLDPSAPGD
jgi:uncharacterized cysteine cluster protein YcgN (CxxCxxCC family)